MLFLPGIKSISGFLDLVGVDVTLVNEFTSKVIDQFNTTLIGIQLLLKKKENPCVILHYDNDNDDTNNNSC